MNKLKQLREERNISQKALGDAVGIKSMKEQDLAFQTARFTG